MKAIIALLMTLTALTCSAAELEIAVAKDTFVRVNEKHRNNGASPQLLVLQSPISRVIMAFDLSSVTNRILSAELRFCPAQTVELNKLDLTICPMVQTARNTAWGEGRGNLSVKGLPAKEGDATFLRSAFPDVLWESASGQPVVGAMDAALWGPPIARLKALEWTKSKWISVPVSNVALLESIRKSNTPIITFGLWGTSGSGFYFISSKESGRSARLVLQLKEEPQNIK